MSELSSIISASVFVIVIILIMSEKLHLTIAALLGALILIFTHTITLTEAVEFISKSHATLVLFFGVMVLIRAFEPTKIFEYIATKMVIIAKGRGKVLILGIIGITTPICAVLPNATTVMLLAPLIPPLAEEIGVNFVPLLILMVFVANSAGLITLVGDPATFIVGDAINMTFLEYLQKLTLGGIIAVVSVAIVAPLLFRKIWNTKFTHLEDLPHPQVNHPRMLILGALIMVFVLTFFVIGDSLAVPISPASVALLGATLALLLAHHSKIDTVHNILRDVDWSTLIFFMSIFVLIGSLEKTGVVSHLSGILALVLGKNIFVGSILLVFVVGILSSVVPNIPLVVAMVPLLKEYLVNVNLVDSSILDPNYTGQLPPEVLPLFYAMMFGATLGGNGTLVGASSNIVAAGIAEQHGKIISFHTFLKYGLPIMTVQLFISSIYIGSFWLFN
ncbi:ArsB/NhaD family transporter [Cyanobacterium aponinum UTEX 3222]|uniref:Transporter n=2 Tax=Cyanobacterium aponinum TaxID=379064 RepID=A0A844GXX3_9CHRO|nr:ArsB/NhaD family transporter [Cyanobacterium aponinum]WRL43585.1 ArsB/NhaD family transporter [Cyanobacterium aponinum UTEX 3222]AFZ54464.1 putative tyrosine transporter P-protein [Cyanobacterium aponinum PCC 10605]MTF38836.1 transporter [Cyanobacterium aponinum 0216]PHV61574.1 transporter [Cyanobacterium aponinum IPPAS B-1201]WRL37235.1 ArsB/NhaD family transporter [Cyanobacterium aponinum UTEX 3221]